VDEYGDQVPLPQDGYDYSVQAAPPVTTEIEYYDAPVIRSINRDAARDNYRVSSWILAIVNSAPFQMRKAPSS